MLQIVGYDILGRKSTEGVRFAWKLAGNERFIESAAFINKTKGISEDICAIQHRLVRGVY